MSGLKQEKKLTEKAEAEIKEEMAMASRAQTEILAESKAIEEVRQELKEIKRLVKEEVAHHHHEPGK